jgi:hypothetical protein
LGPQANFRRHGQSGIWLSDNLPHLSTVIDDIAMLNAVTTDQFNHAPGQLLMHTGSARLGRPSIGSWVTYGMGSENKNLPGFVVLTSGGNDPDAGKSAWGSGFLPSVYQGVQCRSKGDPVLFLSNPEGITSNGRFAEQSYRELTLDTPNFNSIEQDDYREMQFSLPDDIEPFDKFSIKICLFSNNSCVVPKVKDMRAIAVQ